MTRDIKYLAKQAAGHFGRPALPSVQKACPVDGALLLRYTEPTSLDATLYEPVICLILQGSKIVTMGDRTVRFGPGESLIVSHVLPVKSQVTEASRQRPYLALILQLDLAMMRSLHAELDMHVPEAQNASSLEVRRTEQPLLDALSRLLDVANSPEDHQILVPIYMREIHYRLITAQHGTMLRRLMHRDSHASHIARAVTRIRRHMREPVVIADLATAAGMSVSSFHKYFKQITGTTPLQYQKALRLLEARRLLTAEGYAVAQAAFDVGYESPNQFSREYARQFGVAPSREKVG